MKLRVARKILNAPREPDGGSCKRYRDDQLGRALRRIEKTASEKESLRQWCRFMDKLGPEGRAYILRNEKPGAAFRILCDEVEGLRFDKPGRFTDG